MAKRLSKACRVDKVPSGTHPPFDRWMRRSPHLGSSLRSPLPQAGEEANVKWVKQVFCRKTKTRKSTFCFLRPYPPYARCSVAGKLSANSAATTATSVIWRTTLPPTPAPRRYRAAHGSRTGNSKNGRA